MSNPIIIDCKDLLECQKASELVFSDGLDAEKVAKILTLCENCQNKKPELS
jgi:hypothetical protein